MANLRLYFEMLSKQLATTASGPLGYQLPPFRKEDTLDLEISVLKRVSENLAPLFEEQNLSAWSMRATVGTVISGVATSLATTTAFTIDSSGKSLIGSLALNTAAINALSDSAPIFLELIATLNGSNYGARYITRIENGIFTTGLLVAPADDLALGRAEGLRMFVAREGLPGEGFILTAENGVKAFIYLDNDGSLKADPIS
jgi:hypothetical protein